MLNKIKENFKMRYLTLLLVIPMLFVYSGTRANGEIVTVHSEEELREYVKYRLTRQGGIGTFDFVPEHSESFPRFEDPTDPKICEIILDAIADEVEALRGVHSCSTSGNVLNYKYIRIVVNISNSDFYNDYTRLNDYFDGEIAKIMKQTTNKAEVVIKLRDVVKDMVYYKSNSMNFGHPLLSSEYYKAFMERPNFHLSNIFGLAIERLDLNYMMVIGKASYGELRWPIIEIEDNWYHCPSNTVATCLVSDSARDKYTWDNFYPKAPNDYNFTSKETTKIVPVKEVPRPDLEYRRVGEHHWPEHAKELSVGTSDWATEKVTAAIGEGMVPQFSNLYGDYQDDITRGEFSALIVGLYEKIIGSEVDLTIEESKNFPFEDTGADDGNIKKSYKLGIVNGVSANRFEPHQKITREQIAVMFDRTRTAICETRTISKYNLNSESKLLNENLVDEILKENCARIKKTTSSFTDQSEISPWALESVSYLNELGILKGVGDNKINPKGNATKEQAIILAYRLYELYK